MLKNIQNNLLLRHPLLWNTRFVPALAAMIIIHILFFAIGLADGTVNFTQDWNYRYNDTSVTVAFFSVFIAILALILWLVYYFRNNAYKSFYPKTNMSLFKEWLIIAVLCILNCSYFASYEIGKNVRTRSYFAEGEFSRRADIISMASLFIEGPYKEPSYTYENKNGTTVRVQRNSFEYNHRKYAINSLLNKDIVEFTYQSRIKDSLNELRVKKWLIENRKDSVLWLMAEFDKIAKDHNLKGNITPQKWAELVYNHPEFTNNITVGKAEHYVTNSLYYNAADDEDAVVAPQAEVPVYDTISNTYKVIGNEEHAFPKYYVPLKQLESSYNQISASWSSPLIDSDMVLFFKYFGLMLSLLVFSFRVTSGRNWLITLVTLGVMGILTGIFSMIVHIDSFFPFIWMVIIIAMLIYYISTCRAKTSKGFSAIALTGVLWLAPWFIPLLYGVICDFIYWKYTGYDYPIAEKSSLESWIVTNSTAIWAANLLIVFIYMYFLSRSIKKWKGIAEA